jgi:hypothetical protein
MKKETMIAVAENLSNLSKLFAEAAGETESSKAKENPAPKQDIKLEDIRAILAEKSQAGKTKDIRSLLDSFDAEKLSDVKPEQYPKLLEEAKVL